MTSQGELLERIVGRLDDAGIPYMVVGSLASSFHGHPRTTQDIDVVVDPSPETLQRLVTDFEAEGLYVEADAAADALRERTQFNVIDPESGWKLDLIIRRDRPFSTGELGRRLPAELLGTKAFVATAEDTIIAKLEWARSGESERQLRDVSSPAGVTARIGAR